MRPTMERETTRDEARGARAAGAGALAALIAAAALAACGGDAQPGGGASGAGTDADGPSLAAASARGTFRIELRPETDGFPLNEAFALDVVVEGADGAPLAEDASVTIDARMPAHGHGMLRDVELERVGPTEYRAEGMLLHMVGHWEVHVDVTRGAVVERAQADIELEP